MICSSGRCTRIGNGVKQGCLTGSPREIKKQPTGSHMAVTPLITCCCSQAGKHGPGGPIQQHQQGGFAGTCVCVRVCGITWEGDRTFTAHGVGDLPLWRQQGKGRGLLAAGGRTGGSFTKWQQQGLCTAFGPDCTCPWSV